MIDKISPSGALNAAKQGTEKPKRRVEFLVGGEVKTFDRDTVMADVGVADIVRMQPTDFPNINPTPGWEYSHFNFEKTVNTPESPLPYLIVRIAKPGDPGRDPVLTLDGALIAQCIEASSNIPYDKLTDKQLAKSLPGSKDKASLLAAMQQRYGQSRKLSPKQVEDAGVGYTLFRILGPAPASNIVR